MADSPSTLTNRVISALFAGSLVAGTCYFGGREGIYLVITAAIILGVREYSRMVFHKDGLPASVAYLFWIVAVVFYAGMMDHYDLGLLWFSLTNVVFLSGCLWLTRNKVHNDVLLPTLGLGTFGMLLCVLMPNFAVQLAKLEDGAQWFLFLLLVVFAGDTFAYFGGRFFGARRMMPQISPSKTLEGSLSGLLGSALAGAVHTQIALPHAPVVQVVLFCLVCGFTAQSGDLLMSLIKRVAQVKDSGGLMPGHGGILDRLDGVFISCPLVYAFALYVTPQ